MKAAFTYLFIFSFLLDGCAQKAAPVGENPAKLPADSFRLLNIIPGNYTGFEVDAVGNIYLLTVSNQLKKISDEGDSLAVFNDVRRYGNATYIDVSNPLRTLVYYKNFRTIVILDRLLSVRTTLNLRKNQIFKVNAVTTSYDNNIWLFDEQDLKLKKINEEGKILTESNDMRMFSDKIPEPAFIYESDNSVYLYDQLKGFFIFDRYAAFKQFIPVLNWSSVMVNGNFLSGISEGRLHFYDHEKKVTGLHVLPSIFSKAIQIRIMNKRLYILDENGLRIYQNP